MDICVWSAERSTRLDRVGIPVFRDWTSRGQPESVRPDRHRRKFRQLDKDHPQGQRDQDEGQDHLYTLNATPNVTIDLHRARQPPRVMLAASELDRPWTVSSGHGESVNVAL